MDDMNMAADHLDEKKADDMSVDMPMGEEKSEEHTEDPMMPKKDEDGMEGDDNQPM